MSLNRMNTKVFQSTPSVGRATGTRCYRQGLCLFQSTPSVGRATMSVTRHISCRRHFNPRPPWGGRPSRRRFPRRCAKHFNPRPPWGGRLLADDVSFCGKKISIHALRGEGDHFLGARRNFGILISIHALRGEGDIALLGYLILILLFQSTPSVGRATFALKSVIIKEINFNPRPPWGGRPEAAPVKTKDRIISIHALRGEGDCKNIQICNAMLVHSAYKTIYFCDSCAFYLT